MTNDFISRQAAINAILSKPAYHGSEGSFYHVDDIRDALQSLSPTQLEIIRCEDCLHNGSFDTDCPIDWNGKEYCNFAERREDQIKH